MASKRTASKRKRTSNNFTRNKRRRTKHLAYTNAPKPGRHHCPASETFWAATRILQDNGTHYLIEWEGVDPATGNPYESTWEPHSFVTPALKIEWEEAADSRSPVTGQDQAPTYGEANDRSLSPSHLPEALKHAQGARPVQSPTESVLQSRRASTASLQQVRQSRRGSSSLFIEPQEGGCKLETKDLRSRVVVVASPSNSDATSYTTAAPKEASGPNQHDIAMENCSRHITEEDPSDTDPDLPVLQHNLHILPPTLVERADSIEPISQSSQIEFVEKLQACEAQESIDPRNAIQEELDMLEQARQELLETQSCTMEENEPISPTALAEEEPSKVVTEQQKIYNELEPRKLPLPDLSHDAVDWQHEFSAQAELVFQTGIWGKVGHEEVASILPPPETAEEQRQELASLLGPTQRLSKEYEAGGEIDIRNLLASPDASKKLDEFIGAPVPSERSISPFLDRSEPAESRAVNHDHENVVSSASKEEIRHPLTLALSATQLEQKGTSQQKPKICEGTDKDSVLKQAVYDCRTTDGSVSSTTTSGDKFLDSANNRTQSTLHEVSRPRDQPLTALRSLFGPHAPVSWDKPPIIDQGQPQNIELPPQRILPPIYRPEPHRQWTAWPDVPPYDDYQELQHCKSRSTELVHSSMARIHSAMSGVSGPDIVEQISKIETMRAGTDVESDMKRKRQFASRTKNGCLTCRRRKKKCDEAKPKCDTCTRLGFPCNGYSGNIRWPESRATAPSVPLQAKECMPTNTSQPYSESHTRTLPYVRNYEPSLSNSHQDPHSSARNGVRGRPTTFEERTCELPAPSSWKTSWKEPHQISGPSAYPSPPSSYIQPPKPIHERHACHDHQIVMHSIQSSPPSSYGPRICQRNLPGVSQFIAFPPTVAVEAHPQAARRPQQHQNPLSVPLAALGPTMSLPHCTPEPQTQKTERQKMLDGEPFMPDNVQLVNERTQCTAAVNYFNKTINTSPENTQSDYDRYLKRILEAGWIQPCHIERPVSGHLGSDVHVATPFHCDYGYNISVGDNVTIGPNCHLLDSGGIAIGKNSTVGAGVTITTLKTPMDMVSLKRKKGTRVAKGVYIGENVYIGNDCTIEAGVRIGNGAIVYPGSVIVHDIPPNSITHGNPASIHKVDSAT